MSGWTTKTKAQLVGVMVFIYPSASFPIGDIWNARRGLGLAGAEGYHGSLATSPVPPSRPVGCARMAREHNMLWSGQMVLEEASSSDTNLDTPVESCPSLSPESPSYVPHAQRTSSYPSRRDARSQLLRRAFFGMDFLGSALPDEHADSCYACWCFFTLSLIRALSHEVQNSEINWTAEGKVP